MEGDIFTTENNLFEGKQTQKEENNFFLRQDSLLKSARINEPVRHLNDYDSNILGEGAYREVNDEVFRLEYKISKLEERITDIDNQIKIAKDIRDFEHAELLFLQKKQLTEELSELTNVYKEASLSARISGGIATKIKDGFKNAKEKASEIGNGVLSKLSGKFSSVTEVKNSLAKLENINKSVDELMTLQIPYGEAVDKYEQLSKYIAKANSLQAEIYKFLK